LENIVERRVKMSRYLNVIFIRSTIVATVVALLVLLTNNSAFCFDPNSTEQKFIASDGSSGDEFGGGLISGDRAVVAGWLNDEKCGNCGAAYVYELSNGSWIESQKLMASDGGVGSLWSFIRYQW